MKVKLFVIAILVSLGANGCSSKNNSGTVDTEKISEDKTELALEYCRKLLKEFSGEGSGIFSPSAAEDHLMAAQKENPKFFEVGGSGLKKKKDVEFLSIFEESLFDCEKELDKKLSDLRKII